MISLSKLSLIGMGLICGLNAAYGGDQVGTLTQIDGVVKIFSNPSKILPKDPAKDGGSIALFEGEYFQVRDARIGDRMQKGNIVRTSPQAKARIVFENGDQFNVGPATAYRVTWDKDSVDGRAQVSLMYGKVRGIVEKGGPRSKLFIKTRTATMGVRGTDFFIADDGKDGATEVSIIRGSVEVKSSAPRSKPVQVKAGYSVSVVPPPQAAAPATDLGSSQTGRAVPGGGGRGSKAVAPIDHTIVDFTPKIELRQTTQEELSAIQKSSSLEAKKTTDAAKPDAAVAQAVEALEKKAVKTTLKDIQREDPKLFAQLKAQSATQPASTDELNLMAVQKLQVDAPKAPSQRKPYKSELEDLDQGTYDKYFKNVQ